MVNSRQQLDLTQFRAPSGAGVEWLISDAPVAYPEALAAMEQRAAQIALNEAPEQVWLLEHPPLYTSGTSAQAADLLDPRFPVFSTGRGGQFTYHGPGQRVAYLMLDLKRRRPDVRAYVASLEELIIRTLAAAISVAQQGHFFVPASDRGTHARAQRQSMESPCFKMFPSNRAADGHSISDANHNDVTHVHVFALHAVFTTYARKIQ